MSCRLVRSLFSAYLDGEVTPEQSRLLDGHLRSCPGCAEHLRTLQGSLKLLGALPRLQPPDSIASRVMNRIEVESRGPGLALLFRPTWAARPLILPSLVPAALVLVTVMAAALALDRGSRPLAPSAARGQGSWPTRLAPSGTEANPMFPSKGVSVPQLRSRDAFPEEALEAAEATFFLETVVARDGSVATVTLLGGDQEQARPFVDSLRSERFEPARLKGRPVAVSLYRLISRMEVRAPRT
jgi:hypothetical protein